MWYSYLRCARRMLPSLVVVFAILRTVCGSTEAFIGNETLLRKNLITDSNYSNRIRPAEKVDVYVRLNILTLNDLNTKTQTLELTGWLTTTWNDTRLSWTQSDYGGVNYMFETESTFWRPLLYVDNSVGGDKVGTMSMIADDNILLRAKYTGEIMWEPPSIYSTHCEIITTYYPFDVQECYVELVSWSYTVNEVELKHLAHEINLEDYKVNGEWDLLSTRLETNQLIDGHEIFSQLEFIMKLRRRATFYVLNVILPIMLTSFLSLLIFLLPHDSGEKISYALTLLLAYAVLLTLISDNMPSTSHHVSILSIYLSLILMVGAMSVLLGVVSLYLYHQPITKPIPQWIQKVILGLMLKVTGYNLDDEHGHHKRIRKGISKDQIQPMDVDDVLVGKNSPMKEREPTEIAWKSDDPFDRYTWVDLAKIYDCFFYRFYLILVMAITIICLLILIIGGYTS